MPRSRRDNTFDAALELWDGSQGVIAADEVLQVDSAAQILDLGAALFEGKVVADISAVEVASNDERYLLRTQFSNSSTFASGIVNGPMLEFGALEITDSSADIETGRYDLPFSNEINGTLYRYMRGYMAVQGTIATGINGSAFIVKQK